MENNNKHFPPDPGTRDGRQWLFPNWTYSLFLILMAAEMVFGPFSAVGNFSALAIENTYVVLCIVVLAVFVPPSLLINKLAWYAHAQVQWLPEGAATIAAWLIMIFVTTTIIIKTRALRRKTFQWLLRFALLLFVIQLSLSAYLMSRAVFAAFAVAIFAAAVIKRRVRRKRGSVVNLLLPTGSAAATLALATFVGMSVQQAKQIPEESRVIYDGGAYDAVPTGDSGYLVASKDRHVYRMKEAGGTAETIPGISEHMLLRFFLDPSGGRVFLGQRLHNDWKRAPFLNEFKLPEGTLGARLKAPLNFTIAHGAVDSKRHRLYVLQEYGSWLLAYDSETLRPKGEIPLSSVRRFPSYSCEIAANQETGVVYVSNCFLDARIYRYDPETKESFYRRGGGYNGIAIDEKKNILYVARTFGGRIDVLDGETLELLKTYPVELGVRFLAMSPNRNRLYATNFFTGSVKMIDTAGDAKPRLVGVGRSPRGIHYDSFAGGVIVSFSNGVVLIPAE